MYWRNTAVWRPPSISIVTATTNFNRGPNKPTRVLVAAAGPASRIDGAFPRTYDDRRAEVVEAFHVESARVAEAIALSGMRGPATDRVRTALSVLEVYSPPWESPTPSEALQMQNAIVEWLKAARSRPPIRRAAALFVADRLPVATGGPRWAKNERPPIREQIEGVGASFRPYGDGDGDYYTGSWLDQATSLGPNGRMEKLIFVTNIQATDCRNGPGDWFRDVIMQGEEWLRRRPDSPIRAEVQLSIADAYADIVALASGVMPDAGAAWYTREEDTARAKSIEFFRRALEGSAGTVRTRRAWNTPWRLLAGLPPTRTRFVCRGD